MQMRRVVFDQAFLVGADTGELADIASLHVQAGHQLAAFATGRNQRRETGAQDLCARPSAGRHDRVQIEAAPVAMVRVVDIGLAADLHQKGVAVQPGKRAPQPLQVRTRTNGDIDLGEVPAQSFAEGTRDLVEGWRPESCFAQGKCVVNGRHR